MKVEEPYPTLYLLLFSKNHCSHFSSFAKNGVCFCFCTCTWSNQLQVQKFQLLKIISLKSLKVPTQHQEHTCHAFEFRKVQFSAKDKLGVTEQFKIMENRDSDCKMVHKHIFFPSLSG